MFYILHYQLLPSFCLDKEFCLLEYKNIPNIQKIVITLQESKQERFSEFFISYIFLITHSLIGSNNTVKHLKKEKKNYLIHTTEYFITGLQCKLKNNCNFVKNFSIFYYVIFSWFEVIVRQSIFGKYIYLGLTKIQKLLLNNSITLTSIFETGSFVALQYPFSQKILAINSFIQPLLKINFSFTMIFQTFYFKFNFLWIIFLKILLIFKKIKKKTVIFKKKSEIK